MSSKAKLVGGRRKKERKDWKALFTESQVENMLLKKELISKRNVCIDLSKIGTLTYPFAIFQKKYFKIIEKDEHYELHSVDKNE